MCCRCGVRGFTVGLLVEDWMMSRIKAVLNNTNHPQHKTLASQRSSSSDRLVSLDCRTWWSLIPAATGLYNEILSVLLYLRGSILSIYFILVFNFLRMNKVLSTHPLIYSFISLLWVVYVHHPCHSDKTFSIKVSVLLTCHQPGWPF